MENKNYESLSDNELVIILRKEYELGQHRNIKSVTTDFYKDYHEKKGFKYLRKHFSIDEKIADSISLESTQAFWEGIIGKKINAVPNAKLYSYFIRMCRNRMIDYLKESKETFSLEDNKYTEPAESNIEDELIANQIKDLNSLKLKRSMEQLSPKCKRIIQYFYYEGLTHKEIAEIMPYESAQASRNALSRCKGNLRNFYKKAS